MTTTGNLEYQRPILTDHGSVLTRTRGGSGSNAEGVGGGGMFANSSSSTGNNTSGITGASGETNPDTEGNA